MFELTGLAAGQEDVFHGFNMAQDDESELSDSEIPIVEVRAAIEELYEQSRGEEGGGMVRSAMNRFRELKRRFSRKGKGIGKSTTAGEASLTPSASTSALSDQATRYQSRESLPQRRGNKVQMTLQVQC